LFAESSEENQPMRVLVVLFALLLIIMPVAAQNDAPANNRPALLRVLSAAPDTPDIRNAPIIASFVDYRAALASHGINAPASFAALENLSRDAQSNLIQSLPTTGPESLLRSFLLLGDMPSVMGFDFFDIAQAAEIGAVPNSAVLLTGDFDPEAVTTAHIARGYTEQPDDSGTLLCSADGCEDGDGMNLANRLEANPFGGNLGQSQPLVVSDQRILNTRSFPLLRQMSEAAQGRIPSLADAKDVQAVANILAYRTYVNGVVLVSPATISILDATASSGRFSNFMGRLQALPPLPAYSLVAISYTADETYAYGDVLLIYPTLDSASRAYESLTARLEVVESVTIQGRTIQQLLDETGEFVLPQVVTDEKTNLSAVQFTVRVPLDEAEPADFARPFAVFYRMLVQRDTVLFIPTE